MKHATGTREQWLAARLELLQAERQRARRHAGERGPQLGEPPLLAELRQHGHRPLAEQRVGRPGGQHAAREGRGLVTPRRRHVLGAKRVTVALVSARVAEGLERVERSPQGVSADGEAALQLDEPRASALVQQRECGCRPAMVKELDQVAR